LALVFCLIAGLTNPVLAQEAPAPASDPVVIEPIIDPISTETTTESDPITTPEEATDTSTAEESAEPVDPKEPVVDPLLTEEKTLTVTEPEPPQTSIPVQTKANVDQSTGALVYSYQFALPEGRNKLTPELSLNYNSRRANEASTGFGLGWELSVPYIGREPIKGVDNLYNYNFFSSSLDGRLISTGNLTATTSVSSSYRAETDAGDYHKYNFNLTSGWTMTGKDGRTYYFGTSTDSRQDNPADSTQVYRWMLSKIVDSQGNEIQYYYTKSSGQTYLARVVYTYHATAPAIHTIVINYIATPAPDNYQAGFNVVNNKLATSIVVTTNDGLTIRTDTYYTYYEDAQFLTQKNLTSIRKTSDMTGSSSSGFDDRVTFDYSHKVSGWESGTYNLDSSFKLNSDYPGRFPRTADFDGNGLPDILLTDYRDAGRYYNKLWINNGETFVESSVAWNLATTTVVSDNYAVVDLNGDKLPDLHPRNYTTLKPLINTGSGFVADISGIWDVRKYFTQGRNCGVNAGDYYSQRSGDFLFDINNDGKNDIISFGGRNKFFVLLNNGNGWATSTAYTFTPAASTPEIFLDHCGNKDKKSFQTMMDVNGDGREDYIHETYGTFLNTGSGFAYAERYKMYFASNSSSPFAFVDLNGDGLLDYVSRARIDGSWCETVYINKGGFDVLPAGLEDCPSNGIWGNPLNFRDSDGADHGKPIDVSADGLPDVVMKYSGISYNRVKYINSGQNFNYVDSSEDNWGVAGVNNRGAYLDANSDGIIDFITDYSSFVENNSYVQLGRPTIPNRLIRITNQLGAETDITYSTASTDYDDVMPTPIGVVSQIKISNIGQGQPDMVTNYSYANGKYVIDPKIGQKRFAGFHSVTATESGIDLVPQRVTKTYFHQADGQDSATAEPTDTELARIGKVYYTSISKPGTATKKETWNRYASHPLVVAEQVTGRPARFVYPTTVVTKVTDDSTFGTAESYGYDLTIGELNSQIMYGAVNVSSGGNYTNISTAGDRYIDTEYAFNTAKTIVKPKLTILRSSVATSSVVSRTEFIYDSQPLGSISARGNLTKETSWFSGNGVVVASSTYTYDTYGNIASITNPIGARTSYTYDATKTYVATSTNPLGHVAGYGYKVGLINRVTDPNGRLTSYEYYADGRLRRTTRATDEGNYISEQSLDNYGDDFWYVIKRDYPYSALTNQESYQWLDNLGRPTKLITENYDHSTRRRIGYYLMQDKSYDALGRQIAESLPYGVSGPSFYSFYGLTTPATLWSNTNYDGLDRPLTITDALGTTSFTYGGQNTTITDARGKQKTIKTDAFGNLIQVKEKFGANIYQTDYYYDIRNLLTSLTDALGNVRNFTYNNAGWLTGAQDLHATADTTFGNWSFTYDLAGNQLTEVQPTGAIVTRIYDKLNRPTRIDGSTTGSVDYNLTYDNCTNGKGRLCSVAGTLLDGVTMSRSHTYTISGQPATTTLMTLGATYKTNYKYTLSDQVRQTTYSNGNIIRTVYGEWVKPKIYYLQLAGTSSTTATAIATTTYHHTGSIAKIATNNGLVVEYSYNPDKKYQLASSTAIFASTTLMHRFNYNYDPLGNITSIVEPTMTKSYVYDDLNRLTQAIHTPTTGSATTYSYAYNAIGNITVANGQGYTYAGTGLANPHAVTTIGTNAYVYDNNGNMTSAPGLATTYNWQNQPTGFTSADGRLFKSYYDETGERFIYKTPTVTEVQVTDDYIVRGGKPELTLEVGGVPLAIISGSGPSTTVYRTIADHLGTPIKQVNASGTVTETVSYSPFGGVVSQSGSLNAKRGYTGHEEDAETGLVYAEARYYNPTISRFTQQDPSHIYLAHQQFKNLIGIDRSQILLDPQQLNSYSYVRNNPITNIDSTGKSTLSAWVMSPVLTLAQASIWALGSSQMAQGAIFKQDLPISALMIRHSISLNPKEMNVTEDNQSQFGNMIDAIRGSQEFQDRVDKAINSNSSESLASGLSLNDMEFKKGDLSLSIHKANLNIQGKDTGDHYSLNIEVTDTYNFEPSSNYNSFMSQAANNSAVVSQSLGTLSKYSVKAKFKYIHHKKKSSSTKK